MLRSAFFVIALVASIGLGSAVAADFTIVHAFKGGSDSQNPFAGLILGDDGNLYGTTIGTGSRPGKHCSKSCGNGNTYVLGNGNETPVFFFNNKNGSHPIVPLFAYQGALYGTASQGGTPNDPLCTGGCGTVFRFTPDGNTSVLYKFCQQPNCADGYFPASPVIDDGSGNFIGTTEYGGIYGGGTLYKITPDGRETVLYSFCAQGGSSCTDGAGPIGHIARDAAGNIYGNTQTGGSGIGFGVIFKVASDGTETVLHLFCQDFPFCSDGAYPTGGVIIDSAGSLYGTTTFGGNSTCDPDGCGIVFKFDPTAGYSVLHPFAGNLGIGSNPDGQWPRADLLLDTDGTLYGTTSAGGGGHCRPYQNNCGTVFRLTPDGTATTLHSFCTRPACVDGNLPQSGLVVQGDDLIGTATAGGKFGLGLIFSVKKSDDWNR